MGNVPLGVSGGFSEFSSFLFEDYGRQSFSCEQGEEEDHPCKGK